MFQNRFLSLCLAILIASVVSAVLLWTQDAHASVSDLPRKDDRPLENIAGFKTHYGSVRVESDVRLRTLITIPEKPKTPTHPLLFTQWVSCGSLEFKNDNNQLAMIARDSGLALVRVERAGSGDSEGPSCGELDYNTEVQHYITAFKMLLNSELFDSSEVFVYGSSLGSTTAPLVGLALQSAGHNIAGIVVQGGGGLTHYERMLNFDRIYLERRPDAVSPQEIHNEMNARAKFHAAYLIEERHPDEVAKDGPDMAAVRGDVRGLSDTHHYGRPFRWHQQAAQRNFLQAWALLDAQVLVIFNEFEQFEVQHGHQVIVDTVNRLRPGTARLVVQRGLGHSGWRFENAIEAYEDKKGKPEPSTTANTIVQWLRAQ
ncbi:MAG: hypothetical protein AAF438_08760 [Pseudomonadota bacterium]